MTILWLTLLVAVVSMPYICVGQAGGIWVSGDHGIVGSTASGDETHRPPLDVSVATIGRNLTNSAAGTLGHLSYVMALPSAISL